MKWWRIVEKLGSDKTGVEPLAQFEWWLRNTCLGVAKASTSAKILFREYSAKVRTQAAFSCEELLAQLGCHGYRLEDGTILGFLDLVKRKDQSPPAAKEQTTSRSRKPGLFLGSCRELTWHQSIDGHWICAECGMPAYSRRAWVLDHATRRRPRDCPWCASAATARLGV